MSSAPSVPVTTAAPAPPPGVETADLAPASGVEATDLAPPSPDAGDYARIKALFNAVCDLPDIAAQHAALAAQGADAATAERVLALLGHGAAQTRFAAPVAAAAARWLDQELAPGDRLGAWTLEHEMGRGGMGRVFAARRSDGHYEQRAAIKVLLGYTGSEAQQRLMRERQILASLEHPNIARLLDGGTTPAGLTWSWSLPRASRSTATPRRSGSTSTHGCSSQTQCARRWPTRTGTWSSTATSSPATCWWMPTAGCG
jgi:hypothetical protein